MCTVPYRLSPIGAHTDHQGGLATGFTLDRAVRLRFRAVPEGFVRLSSREFEGEAFFPLDRIPGEGPAWTVYVRGVCREAVRALGIRAGIEGRLEGDLPPGGIASSAALEVAVLLALLDASGMALPPGRMTRLVVDAERQESGVAVGDLDPAVILHGKEKALVVLDAMTGKTRLHRWHRDLPPHRWLLVDSGQRRDLRTSAYNERVAECAEAARLLGVPTASPRLMEARWADLLRLRAQMPPTLRNRAEHVFAEHKRVRAATMALSEGDLPAFGTLMTASGRSLLDLFDAGTPATAELVRLLVRCKGVLGANPAGGGFGGHVQALVLPGTESTIEAELVAAYAERFPEEASRLRVFAVGSGPGPEVEDA